MKVKEIKSPVSSVSGVGPQLTKLLAKINIFTAGDLLSYYPKDYEDLSVKVPLCEFKNHSKIHTHTLKWISLSGSQQYSQHFCDSFDSVYSTIISVNL